MYVVCGDLFQLILQYTSYIRLTIILIELFYSITNKFNVMCFIASRISYTRRKNESNMIVSVSTTNNFLGMKLSLLVSIVVTVYDVVYSFTQLFYNLAIMLDPSQMLELIMYVFIDLYLLYVEICWMCL